MAEYRICNSGAARQKCVVCGECWQWYAGENVCRLKPEWGMALVCDECLRKLEPGLYEKLTCQRTKHGGTPGKKPDQGAWGPCFPKDA